MKFLKYFSVLTCLIQTNLIQTSIASHFAKCNGILNLAWGDRGFDKTSHSQQGSYCAVMLDGFLTSEKVVKKYKNLGKKTIAYTTVGTLEKGRPDYNHFPKNALLNKHNDFGEQWINPKHWELLKPVMRNRFRLFKVKGFDAVEIDNIDLIGNVHEANMQNVFSYAVWLSTTAHNIGLKIILKNTPYLCKKLVPYFDAIITESADTYPDDINYYKYFLDANKQWFDFEYHRVSSNHKVLHLASNVYHATDHGWVRQT